MFMRALFTFLAVLSLQVRGVALGSDGEGQVRIGETAPTFRLESLTGDTVSLAALRGKVVIIHFAASW